MVYDFVPIFLSFFSSRENLGFSSYWQNPWFSHNYAKKKFYFHYIDAILKWGFLKA